MNSCVLCNCGTEVAKYYDLFVKAKKEGKQEELFDKLDLAMCCRKELTSMIQFVDYLARQEKK